MSERIPLNAVQEAAFFLLSQGQTTPVFDDIPDYKKNEDGSYILDEDNDPIPIEMPYIVLGAFTCKPNGAKGTNIYDVTTQIHIYSAHKGKKEVNAIGNDIAGVFSRYRLNLSSEGFKTISQGMDMFESFPGEEYGYHGVYTLAAKIQDMEG